MSGDDFTYDPNVRNTWQGIPLTAEAIKAGHVHQALDRYVFPKPGVVRRTGPARVQDDLPTPTVLELMTGNQPPAIANDLQDTGVSASGVALNWGPAFDLVGVASYRIYRDGVQIAELSGHLLSFLDQGVAQLTAHSYHIVAVDYAGNESRASDTVTVNVPDWEPPSTPGALTVGTITATSVQIFWGAADDNVGVTGYSVFRDGVHVADVNGGGTSYIDNGLLPQSTHTYTVAAFDAADNSSTSAIPVTATTMADRTTTIYDSFSRANMALPGSATEVGALTWAAISGCPLLDIRSGKITAAETAGRAINYVPVGNGDEFQVSLNTSIAAGQIMGVYIGRSDTGDGVIFTVQDSVLVGGKSFNVSETKSNATWLGTLADSQTAMINTSYVPIMHVSDTGLVTCTVNGTKIWEGTPASFASLPATNTWFAGIFTVGGNVGIGDEFRVTTVPPIPFPIIASFTEANQPVAGSSTDTNVPWTVTSGADFEIVNNEVHYAGTVQGAMSIPGVKAVVEMSADLTLPVGSDANALVGFCLGDTDKHGTSATVQSGLYLTYTTAGIKVYDTDGVMKASSAGIYQPVPTIGTKQTIRMRLNRVTGRVSVTDNGTYEESFTLTAAQLATYNALSKITPKIIARATSAALPVVVDNVEIRDAYKMTTQVSDSFTAADGTAIAGHAPEIGKKIWQMYAGVGSATIKGGQMVIPGNSKTNFPTMSTTTGDLAKSSFDFTPMGAGISFVFKRTADNTNVLFVQVVPTGVYVSAQYSGGSVNKTFAWESFGSVFTVGRTYHFDITYDVTDGVIQVMVDGVRADDSTIAMPDVSRRNVLNNTTEYLGTQTMTSDVEIDNYVFVTS